VSDASHPDRPGGPGRADAVREAALAAITERARGVRKAAPRWLWIAAIAVGCLAAVGFAIAMLSPGAPAASEHAPHAVEHPASYRALYSGPTGLVIGAAIGVAIGLALARQRRSHSSRNSP